MEKATFYYECKNKKKVREMILRVIELRKEQLKHFETLFINPIKDNIKLLKNCLFQNSEQRSIEYVLRESDRLHNYIFEALNEGVKK